MKTTEIHAYKDNRNLDKKNIDKERERGERERERGRERERERGGGEESSSDRMKETATFRSIPSLELCLYTYR